EQVLHGIGRSRREAGERGERVIRSAPEVEVLIAEQLLLCRRDELLGQSGAVAAQSDEAPFPAAHLVPARFAVQHGHVEAADEQVGPAALQPPELVGRQDARLHVRRRDAAPQHADERRQAAAVGRAAPEALIPALHEGGVGGAWGPCGGGCGTKPQPPFQLPPWSPRIWRMARRAARRTSGSVSCAAAVASASSTRGSPVSPSSSAAASRRLALTLSSSVRTRAAPPAGRRAP